jgi:hypothetical protein
MAIFKSSNFLTASTDGAFDALHEPGAIAPFTGILRCEGCGHEVVSHEGKPLPRHNHHAHSRLEGAIRWRFIVCAQNK